MYVWSKTSAAQDLEVTSNCSHHAAHQLSLTMLQTLNLWANATQQTTVEIVLQNEHSPFTHQLKTYNAIPQEEGEERKKPPRSGFVLSKIHDYIHLLAKSIKLFLASSSCKILLGVGGAVYLGFFRLFLVFFFKYSKQTKPSEVQR